eukprot:1160163-Pelagomonas_calceolata.AAC.7
MHTRCSSSPGSSVMDSFFSRLLVSAANICNACVPPCAARHMLLCIIATPAARRDWIVQRFKPSFLKSSSCLQCAGWPKLWWSSAVHRMLEGLPAPPSAVCGKKRGNKSAT